jgi:MYXO-CTERM domain-containing protein
MPAAPRPTTIRGAVLLALATCLVASPASAYVRSRSRDGKFPLSWADARITMTLKMSGKQAVPADDFLEAARRAAAAWSAPGLDSSVAITIDSSTEVSGGTQYDQINVVSFRTDSWPEPQYHDSALALTTVWNQDGLLVDTDTEINAVNPSFTWGLLPDDPALAAMASEVDLQNALTHEFGHVIGLSHPCYLDEPGKGEVVDDGTDVPSCADPGLPASVKDATMYPSSQPGSIAERTLSPDEMRFLRDVYPLRADPPPGLGDRGGGCSVGPSGTAPGAALALAALTLLARRRRSST